MARLVCVLLLVVALCALPIAPESGDGLLRVKGYYFTDKAYDFASDDDRAVMETLIARCMKTPADEDAIHQTLVRSFQIVRPFVREENGLLYEYAFFNNSPLLAVIEYDYKNTQKQQKLL